MNNALRTQSINRTVAVVVRHAMDLDHAVDVLTDEFGFDQVLQSLARIDDDPKALEAMYTALCSMVLGGEVADGPAV